MSGQTPPTRQKPDTLRGLIDASLTVLLWLMLIVAIYCLLSGMSRSGSEQSVLNTSWAVITVSASALLISGRLSSSR